MKQVIKHVIRGCGNLPTFGHHPGTEVLLLIILGNVLLVGIVGFIFSSIILIPMYLYGAYQRSIGDPDPKRDAQEKESFIV